MNFYEINPFIRFAEIIHYASPGTDSYVRDCRIFYILSGTAVIRIAQQEYTLSPNSIFYCRSGSTYSISSPGVELISLNFDLTQSRNTIIAPFSPLKINLHRELPKCEVLHIDDCEFLNDHIVLSDSMRYHEQLQHILTDFSGQKSLFRANCSALLKIILLQMHRQSKDSEALASKAVRIIMEHIEKNLSSQLSNQYFSSLTGYHEHHLNRLFLQHTGFPIHQYILNARITRAKQLLLSTDMLLSEIAEEIGFNSNTYFSSYFRHVVGISPRSFRNKYKKTI